MTDYPGFDFIQARYQYGGFDSGFPKYLLTHCLECNHKLVVRSLAGTAGVNDSGWLQGDEQHSVHTMTDPFEGVGCVHSDHRALHCGNGNSYSLGNEHTGFAEDSVATWNSPIALQMLDISAKNEAWQWVNVIMPINGITYLPRYLSLVEIAAGVVCGLMTHNDARIVWGNTTHWDPGPNFPYAYHQAAIQREVQTLLGNTPPEDDMSQQDKDNIAALQTAVAALKSGAANEASTRASAVATLTAGINGLKATAASHASTLKQLDGLTKRLAAAQGPLEAGYNVIRVSLAATNGVVNALKARIK